MLFETVCYSSIFFFQKNEQVIQILTSGVINDPFKRYTGIPDWYVVYTTFSNFQSFKVSGTNTAADQSQQDRYLNLLYGIALTLVMYNRPSQQKQVKTQELK